MLVLQNYDEEPSAKVEPRFFKEAVRTRMFELNLLLFLTTMVSACRQVILHLFERSFADCCSPFIMGLCRVCIRMACITLFDFRIIHVMSTSYSLRSSILIADLVSLFLHEAQMSYAEQPPQKQTSLDPFESHRDAGEPDSSAGSNRRQSAPKGVKLRSQRVRKSDGFQIDSH